MDLRSLFDRTAQELDRTVDRSAKTIDRSTRSLADRLGDIPDHLEGIPHALGAVPGALGSVPAAIERLPKQIERRARRIEQLRRPPRRDPSPMAGVALLGGLGLGMAAMWFFDPEHGAHRRALLRDRVGTWTRSTGQALEGASRDLSNRTQGAVAEADATLGSMRGEEDVDDAVLAERVRSQLGRTASQIGRIDVVAKAGNITLSGSAPAGEIDTLIAEASAVGGVRSVENRLDAEGSGATNGSAGTFNAAELSRES